MEKYRVFVKSPAKQDLREVRLRCEKFDKANAQKFVKGFYSSIKTLEVFPLTGISLQRINYLLKEYRFLKYNDYAIVYKIKENVVYIERLYHFARDLTRLELG